MKDLHKKISDDLIAPCGMNCSICSKYLSYINNRKGSKCSGCKPSIKGVIIFLANVKGLIILKILIPFSVMNVTYTLVKKLIVWIKGIEIVII